MASVHDMEVNLESDAAGTLRVVFGVDGDRQYVSITSQQGTHLAGACDERVEAIASLVASGKYSGDFVLSRVLMIMIEELRRWGVRRPPRVPRPAGGDWLQQLHRGRVSGRPLTPHTQLTWS